MEIHFTGGEPTAHPQFPTIAAICRETAISLSITTGGWVGTGFGYDLLKGISVERLYVSLDDADPQANDHVRGLGAFRRATETIRAAVRLRERTGRPEVTVITVVHQMNILRLDAVSRFVGEIGADRWRPTYLEAANLMPQLRPSASNLAILAARRSTDPDLDNRLGGFLRPDNVPMDLVTEGCIGDKRRVGDCPILGRLAIVHPDGSVFGCYGSEYADLPPIADFVAGFVDAHSMLQLARTACPSPVCRTCPEPYQTSIRLRRGGACG